MVTASAKLDQKSIRKVRIYCIFGREQVLLPNLLLPLHPLCCRQRISCKIHHYH